jgi:multiple sugar transport system permease protein
VLFLKESFQDDPNQNMMKTSLNLRNCVTAYLFLLPLLFVLFVLIAYPFFYAIVISLTDYVLGLPRTFVGLKNYFSVIQTNIFKKALYNTLVFSIGTTCFRMLLGLGMALLLNQSLRMRAFLRGFFLLPWVVPAVAGALLWFWILNDSFGIINVLIGKIGLQPIAWLADRSLALPSVIFVNVWRGFPFFGICLLAGLQTIPTELYDAAKVDGASSWQQFIYVTIPSLMPVLMVTTLLSLIWTFNEFQMVYILTRGGPANLTLLLGIHSYFTAVEALHLGKGTAISLVSVPFLVLIVIFNFYLVKKGDVK